MTDPSLYRLWGLPPLQSQVLYGGEAILEIWGRPSHEARQTVTRVVLRRDGRGFVQARAGDVCCRPEIARRVEVDAELPADRIARLRALAESPIWGRPRHVVAQEPYATSGAVCVAGASWDLILVTETWSRRLRRACDDAEVGEAADVLEAVLQAALGREPRYDVLFPDRADFADERAEHARLLAAGGRLDGIRPGEDR